MDILAVESATGYEEGQAFNTKENGKFLGEVSC